MDRVECVTVQVPWSHSFGGGTKGSLEVVVDALVGSGRYLDGARRLMGFGDASVGAAAEAVVVVASSSAIAGAVNREDKNENWHFPMEPA